MNLVTKSALGLCCSALGMSQVFATDTTEIDMTCDSEKPVIMLVAGRTLDAERMRNYAIALGSSDLYPNARGYYLNIPRPVRILEGEPDTNDVALMVRFPSECSAVNFWYDDFYQTGIKPMRLNPSAGDYVVTLYNEADLPPYMAGKVGDNAYASE
mgnify:FL=1|tara:strand:+ start:977 stop:1444 length:468 start_codon:yes stop_codon:yes gene_type:complete